MMLEICKTPFYSRPATFSLRWADVKGLDHYANPRATKASLRRIAKLED